MIGRFCQLWNMPTGEWAHKKFCYLSHLHRALLVSQGLGPVMAARGVIRRATLQGPN